MSELDRTSSRAKRVAVLGKQRYRRQFLREDGRQTSVVIAAVTGAYMASIGNDFALLHGGPLLFVSIGVKVVLLLITGVVLVLLHRAEWPRQQDRAFNLILLAMAVLLTVNNLTRIPCGQTLGVVISGSTLLGLLYFAQRGPVCPRALVSCFITTGIAAVLLAARGHGGLDPTLRVTSILALIALNVTGIFSARAFEQQRRRRFDAERRERQARRELGERMRELVVEKERAEAMSRARAAFLAAMSHEFRTPMNAVIGLSDVVLDTPPGPGLSVENRGHLGTIGDSARALLGLLNEILDFAKIDAQKLSLAAAPFDLHRLLASVADMLRPAAMARSLAFSLELSPDLPQYVVGDDARLRQVLVNLVGNAVKFTERGAVWLRVESCEADTGSEHEVAVRVEDTGIGMTPEVVARLFQPFEQGSGGITRRHGGTGLGLAISKQIVAAMGSDIHVKSEPGRGSVFSFTLRLAEAAAPHAATLVLAPGSDRLPLRILVVDDHRINREVACARIGRLGYPVDLAEGGQEAVLAVSKKTYDVVLMDLHMPGMGGIEATARIGERYAGQHAPHVVAMTASVFEEDREACRRAGMRDFIGKPIDLAQLDAVLSRIAAERGAAAPRLAPEQLARLHRLEVLGDPGFFEHICRTFLVDAAARLGTMRNAHGRRDAPGIEREAHPLKSSSATLGAVEMSALCAAVESAAREGRIEEAGAGIEAIALQLVAVERELLRELESLPRPALQGVA